MSFNAAQHWLGLCSQSNKIRVESLVALCSKYKLLENKEQVALLSLLVEHFSMDVSYRVRHVPSSVKINMVLL